MTEAPMDKVIRLRILRRDSPEARPYWQDFCLPWRPNLNVISCLMEIQAKPVSAEGLAVAPVAWESNCLEEVCGSCSMVINGRPRQACTTLVDSLSQPIELRPLSKFKGVRDLIVDRTPMFQALAKVKAWVPIDGTHDLGPGPKMAESERERAYQFSRCMTCGCCMESCPQYQLGGDFIGPAPLGQAHLFIQHPTGGLNKADKLHAVMGKGGVADCGKAQNCAKACPKQIPLTDAIAELGRETTLQWFKDLLGQTR